MDYVKYAVLVMILGYIGYSVLGPGLSGDTRKNGVILGLLVLVGWLFVVLLE